MKRTWVIISLLTIGSVIMTSCSKYTTPGEAAAGGSRCGRTVR